MADIQLPQPNLQFELDDMVLLEDRLVIRFHNGMLIDFSSEETNILMKRFKESVQSTEFERRNSIRLEQLMMGKLHEAIA